MIYILFLIIALIAAVLKPVGLQKCNAVIPETSDDHQFIPATITALDVKKVFSSIPYKPAHEVKMVYSVMPAEKYRKTILEGDGNCSNQVFGLAYFLIKNKIDYQIIHIMPCDSFLKGEGHTVINTLFRFDGKDHIGIVDVLEKGIPGTEGRILTRKDLMQGAIHKFSLVPLNNNEDNKSPYYGNVLNNAVVGYIQADEVARYFSFIESVYLPLGSEKAEKYIYDGLSILLGCYPHIFVSKSDYKRLFLNHGKERFFFICALWLFRSAVIALPMLIIVKAKHNRTKHISTAPAFQEVV